MAEAAALLGAFGAATLLLASSRAALLAGLVLAALALAGLAADGGQLDSVGTLLDSPAGIAALAAALGILAAAAVALVRWPIALAPAMLALAPIRLPIASDPDSPVLLSVAGGGAQGRLYPLYAVLAAATLAVASRTLRDEPVRRLPRAVAVPAAGFLAVVLVSFLWAEDERAARTDLLFTWVPFVLLLVVVAQAPLRSRSPRILAVTLVAIAGLFSAVAIWQAASERLLFYTVSLQQANELSSLFRVTSAFQDPNHLGRHLVLAIAVVLVAAWLARLSLPVAMGLLALLGAGLWFTYSQSSLVTLATVALAVALAAARGRPRRVLAATTATLLVAAVAGLVVLLASGSAASVTSDRSTLVTDTAAVAASHPIVGVGVASQPLATQREEAPGASKLHNVSHTTPLTVAAELGVVGLALFVALLVGTARVLAGLARTERALALGIGAVLLALLVHSLFYGGLFENPIAWGAIGLAAAGSQAGVGVPRPHPALRS